MDTPNDGIIRITDQTPDIEAIGALLRAFFAFTFSRKANQFTEITFRNRNVKPIADTVIIVTHRMPGSMVKVQTAFRAAWATMNANQQMRVVMIIEDILNEE